MLLAIDEKPYMLRHGTGRSTRHLILLRLSDGDVDTWTKALGYEPAVVYMGKFKFMAFPLGTGAKIGTIDKKLYDPEKKRWTATIAVIGFK